VRRYLVAVAAAVVLTVLAGTAWAYWSVGSVAGGGGAAGASTVNQGTTPTASATGANVTVSWAATTLANGVPVGGYVVKRYDATTSATQTVLAGCTGTVTATSCVENGVPNGSWRYTVTPVLATNWQGAESSKSATVVVNTDPTPPTNSLSLSSVTGGAFLSGSTVYYRGSSAGSLKLTNAVADAGSGPASSSTAALGGTTTGWTHTPSTVSSPSGGPYVSNLFSWTAGTTTSPTESVTGRDVAGNTAVTGLTFTNDSAAPTAGTINYADGLATTRSVSITFTSGTDAASGIATRQLQRAAATLTAGGSCGTFGSFANIGSDSPASPYVDGSLGSACYKYRYVVTDQVGNQTVATSTSVVKVGYAAAVNTTTGLLSYWRLGEAAQSVTVEDAFTGASGTALTSHTSASGITWSHLDGTADAILTDANRVRRGTPDALQPAYTVDYANTTPSGADYSVSATMVVKSNMSGDYVGVIGRLNPTTGAFYLGRWEQSNTSWNIYECDNATSCTRLVRVTGQAALTVNQSYRLKLELAGTSLKLYVNGVLKVSATDSTLTAAGRAGIMDGNPGASVFATNKTNTTGIHLDDFQVIPSTYLKANDDKGTNHGDYMNGVTPGVAGALAGDPNTAAQFDGVNDYVQMTGTTGIPIGSSSRSVEAWFKTTSSARQVLFDYGSLTTNQEFGLWIDSGGASMTAWGWGGGNDKTFTMQAAVNNGAWHHVVLTWDGTTLTLYIDGVALPTQTATRATVMDAHGFGIGAVINPDDGNSGGFFNGTIDEVSLYTSTLSAATVTSHYQLGGATSVDTAGPTGGSVDATGLVGTGSRYAPSTTLGLALATGTDPSGVATSGNQLLRATATLTGGSCGTYGAYTVVANDPTSPASDTVADGACYSYQYVVSDTLGNPTTYTSPDIKVDVATPAAPTLAFSSLTNAYWAGNGSTVFYRSAATSGSLQVTATATAPSGVTGYAFPALGGGWTATPGATGVTTYSWSAAGPAAPGSKAVTATTNAGATSSAAAFTLAADDAAPTGSTLSYLNGSTTSTTVTVTLGNGTDAGSGIGTRLLQRASATLTNGTCGSFGSYATVTNGTNPTSPVADTVSVNTCYQYRYVVADNLGNTATVAGSSVVKVIPTYATTISGAAGLVNWWRLGEASNASPAVDAKGSNNGTYTNGPTVGVAGAIAGDSNTAAQLDGVNDYVTATRSVSSDFSIEFWFKSTQGIGTGTSWTSGAGLVDADATGTASDFGVSLRSDGKIVAGVGGASETSIVSSTGGFNNGAWHHVVFTRVRSSGALVLYVDGASVATGTGGTNNLTSSSTISLGRINTGTNYLQGTLDEVAVYNNVMTAATVSAHYSTGTTP
jgi:hypothetical protein